MKQSVKHKLFIFISSLIIFYVLLSWFLNSQFLDKYYLYNKKRILVESYKQINSLYKGDPTRLSLELEKLESMRGLRIIIFDQNFNHKYDSYPGRGYWRPKPPRGNRHTEEGPMPLEKVIGFREREILKGKTVIRILTNANLKADFIYLFAKLDNGDILFLSTPVAAIKESVQIANQFFLFTGLFVIITGSILVFVLAGRFTQPLLELSEIARKMAMLDFSHKYPVKTNDEIGELGISINSLSDQLEKSIFELKEANEKLKDDVERERKIDEMRKEFISNVSHELKTPIALIQGYAEGLKLNVNEDEANKNFYCDVIADEAKKMNKLVQQLLDLSQIEAGYFHLERSEFNLSALVEQVLKKNELLFKEKNLQLVFMKERELKVNADYDRIEQVLVNYLNNAVNHVDEKKIIKVSIKEENQKARISVYNSGKHIPEEYFDKIWASFYKIDKSRTRKYGGTGLGLSIVKAIQEAHHNNYGVNNVEGGVEFWFELDLAE